ncbi:hypothetical protein, partial [Streptomyces sp. NPDC001089]
FLCTHPLGLSSGRFPSVLRFRLYQTVSVSDFPGAFQVPAFAFPFPATPTLPDPFSVPFPVGIHFQWPLEEPLPTRALRLSFGESDFIRSF